MVFYVQSTGTVISGRDSEREKTEKKRKRKIQTHKRFKRTFIYCDIDTTMQMLRETPFFGPQTTKNGSLGNMATDERAKVLTKNWG